MNVRFLLDENVPLLLKRALLRREPRVDVIRSDDDEVLITIIIISYNEPNVKPGAQVLAPPRTVTS